MTLFDWLEAMDAMISELHTGRMLAGAIFVSLLVVLGVGFRKTRRLLSLHEAEAALEADFKRLEHSSSSREG